MHRLVVNLSLFSVLKRLYINLWLVYTHIISISVLFTWKRLSSEISFDWIILIIQMTEAFLIFIYGLPAFQTAQGIRILVMILNDMSLIYSESSSRLIKNSTSPRASIFISSSLLGATIASRISNTVSRTSAN